MEAKNRYGNKFGYHTPRRTALAYKTFNNLTNLDWSDNSWHNDLCDSIEHHFVDGEVWIGIFIPNSDKMDINNEEWNTFTVYNENQDTLFESDNIYKVIEFINQNYS